jgi:hypothetical protein
MGWKLNSIRLKTPLVEITIVKDEREDHEAVRVNKNMDTRPQQITFGGWKFNTGILLLVFCLIALLPGTEIQPHGYITLGVVAFVGVWLILAGSNRNYL